MENKLAVLKCLADRSRMDIIRILYAEDSWVELIASKLDLTPATVCYHLKKLESAGIVCASRSQFYIIYSLNREIFDLPLGDFLFGDEVPKPDSSPDKFEKEVISRFFRYGKLTALPVQRKKREIVLAYIAKRFEQGRDYTEKEIDGAIHEFFDDHCTLRREMIAAGLMTRENGIYRLTEDKKHETP